MRISAVRFRRPVEGPDGKPLDRVDSAELADGLVAVEQRRYPLHMVESFDVGGCPVCGGKRPAGAKGETCGDRACAAKLRWSKKKPG